GRVSPRAPHDGLTGDLGRRRPHAARNRAACDGQAARRERQRGRRVGARGRPSEARRRAAREGGAVLMKLGHIFIVLRARFGLVLGVLCLVVAFVGTLSVVLPKRYVAAVSLVVDTKAADPVTGALLPLQMLPGYLATQIDIIKSHSVALKVVDRLKLTELPA